MRSCVNERSHSVNLSNLLFLVLLLTSVNCIAEESYLFSAPPMETVEDGILTYGPVAEYLSQVLSKKIEYRDPGNWLSYSADMPLTPHACCKDPWRICISFRC